MDDYHKISAISRSQIVNVLDSEEKFLSGVEPTRNMDIGSYLHDQILQTSENNYVEVGDVNWSLMQDKLDVAHEVFIKTGVRFKPSKGTTRAEVENYARDAGVILVTNKDKELARSIIKSLENRDCSGINCLEFHKGNILRLIRSGETEQIITSTLDKTRYKCKVDSLIELDEYILLIDIKKTASTDKIAFARSCDKYGYHIQAQLYSSLAQKRYKKPAIMAFVCYEEKQPHCPRIFTLRENVLDDAQTLIDIGTERIKMAKARMSSGKSPKLRQNIDGLPVFFSMKDEIYERDEVIL